MNEPCESAFLPLPWCRNFGAGLSTLFLIIAAAALVSSTITAMAVNVEMRMPRAIGDGPTHSASLPSAIADESVG
jgi:hypothetical protein